MASAVDLIYRLENINAEEGVDVFEIAPVLMHFGELIRSASAVLGYEQKIDVRVKPFSEGSWIAQFVLQQTHLASVLTYLHSTEGSELLLLLSLLGLNVRDGFKGVSGIIRFTKGKVSDFKKSGDTVTYFNDKGEKMIVSLQEHKLTQSPLIQNYYYNSVIAPLDKFPSASAVSVRVNKDGQPEQRFTQADKPAFEEYAKSEILEDVEENTSMMKGVFLKPKRGSYSGLEQSYSFILGDINLWPVTIEDDLFLSKLQSGDIRLYAEDVLRVDLEVRQKKDASNKVHATYAIVRVIEYIKYEKPKQLKIEDITKGE